MIALSRWFILPTVAALLTLRASLVPAPSGDATIRRPTAVPVITALTPRGVYAGITGFQLTVDGSNFEVGAQIRWNGVQRATTFVSATRLTTTVSVQEVSAVASINVTVVNPNAGGGTSNAVVFPIINPSPTIASLSPSTGLLLGEDFPLTVLGPGLVQGSIVHLNGTPRPTTFATSGRLVARVWAADLAAPGNASITVVNPAPGGGVSPPVSLPIRLLRPTISTLTPSFRQVNTGAFTLRVTGSNFTRSTVARWNGQNRLTTFLTPTDLAVAIAADDVDQAGAVLVTARSTAPNVAAETSGNEVFQVANPAPGLVGRPTPLPVFRLHPVEMTYTGNNFMPNLVVRVNGTARATTVVSSTQLRVRLDSADVADTGAVRLYFHNPAPVMGVPYATLGILNPLPVATGLNPKNVFVGARVPTTLRVTGSRFVPGAVVHANGTPRPTTFISTTELQASLPPGVLSTGGDLPIKVVTPAPGGGTSATLSLLRLYQQTTVKQ